MVGLFLLFMDQYYKIKALGNLGSYSDDYFKSNFGFGRGRQDALDIIDNNKKNDPAFIAEQQRNDTIDLNKAQEAKQADFLGRFRTAVAGQETLPDMAGRIGGELGLPGLRDTSQGLIKTLSTIPQTQTNATRGFNVNSNQLARIIGSKQAEIAPAAQQAVTQQQSAESNLATQLGYGVAQQQKELMPFSTEQNMLSEQLAREYSGFTQDKQSQLEVALQQMANGQALTMAQLQHANNLALQAAQYDKTKDQVGQLISVAPGNSLYNPSGQLVATAPKPLASVASSGW